VKRFYSLRKHEIPVKVSLEEVNEQCKIAFSDSQEETTIREISVRCTSDAISILRSGYSLQSSIDKSMTWNSYHDVDYGDFDSLKPFVETDSAVRTKTRIPVLLCDLLDSEQEHLELVLTHDEANCPVMKDGFLDMGRAGE